MKLEFDYTLLVQFAQFLVLLILLHFLVFKPVLRALGRRQDAIQSLAGKAEGGAREVETLGRTYDESLKGKKLPILQERDTLLKQGHEASVQVIEEARRDLAEELAKVKDGVKKEAEKTRENLKGQSEAFVGEIVQKIMMRGGLMLGENLPIWLKLLIQFVNFAILLGVILKFAGKPLKEYLRKRHQAVKERIDEAEKALREAAAAKLRYEEKLAGLEGEIEEFRKSITEAMEKEKRKVLDEAHELAARIREQARLAYEHEMKEAMEKVRAEITAQSIEAATVRVREMFRQEDHDRMVEEFIEKVRSTN